MFVYASHVLSEVSHELRTVEASSFVSSSESTFWLILPFLLSFRSVEPFLKIFSYKKFSRVVVYCSVINVLCFSLLLTSAATLLSYHIVLRLSRTFLILFFCFLTALSRVSLYILAFLSLSVKNYFKKNLILFSRHFTKSLLCKKQNGEGGI